MNAFPTLSRFFALLALLALLSPPLLPPIHAAPKQIYQSPMHPWITSDKPGRCTICGMPLVLVTVDDEDAGEMHRTALAATPPTDGAALVTLTTAQHSVSGIQTAPVTRGTLTRTLRVNGTIEDDETRHRILAARVPGRVETLHINYVGAEVRAGEPLAALYSPEILTAQRNYLEHLRAGEAFAATARDTARERLLELGLTAAEIATLETTGTPSTTHTVRAPLSGTVVARAAYEGQYVAVNDPLFEICDLSRVWFIFDLYEPDLAWVSLGQEVEVALPSLPGEVLRAPISFINPNLDPTTRTARARVVLDNAARKLLRHQTATATVHAAYAERLLVPRSAVLQHSGIATVFVETAPRRYAARAVTLGRLGQAQAEVLSGLAEGERVVVEGGLILDGQAQLAQVNAAHANRAPRADAHTSARRSGNDAAPKAHTSHAAQSSPLDEAARSALLNAALAAADAARALADDDLPAYQRLLPALRDATRHYLAHRDAETGESRSGSAATPNKKAEDLAALLATLSDVLPSRDPISAARPKPLTSSDMQQRFLKARSAFEPFSTALADLVLAAHLHHPASRTNGDGSAAKAVLRTSPALHVFQCPMTPVLGTGRWLSRSPELRNPFFGELMLDCGEEVTR